MEYLAEIAAAARFRNVQTINQLKREKCFRQLPLSMENNVRPTQLVINSYFFKKLLLSPAYLKIIEGYFKKVLKCL